MKERILTKWTFTRALYVLMGVAIIIQSALNQQWFGIAFGAYFASMGLFAFGCASGSCFGGSCVPEPPQKPKAEIQNADPETIKTK